MAVTQFADLTEEEFREEILGGYIRTPQSPHQGNTTAISGHALLVRPGQRERTEVRDLPESVDWREKGVVSDPKNQVRLTIQLCTDLRALR